MATLRFDNPFHDLWVTEILDPSAFVRMFSDVLVRDAEALFSTGNIVIKGRQGSGKSMLLTLLETSTRIAYGTTHTPYPVPAKQRKFLSAGVQLTQQSAALVAARAQEWPVDRRSQIAAANFADYLNSLLCRDLLRNVETLAVEQRANPSLLPEVHVDWSAAAQELCLRLLVAQESWQGVFAGDVGSIPQLIATIDARIKAHRLYSNGVLEGLPRDLEETRAPAGVPIAELASALRESQVLPRDTLVLLRIDQHEELFELERHSGMGSVFRQVLNGALARRDPRVAYRIGTRHYAWEVEPTTWGSRAPLEQERDYGVIDLDAILRRGEHARGWKFPKLAEDVLRKRVLFAGFAVDGNPIETLFGRSLTAKERARKYVGTSESAVRSEPEWAPEWKNYLDALWNSGEPLDAKFGEAWLSQEAQRKGKVAGNASLASGMPWRRTEWWAKERNEIALLQLAGDRQQALIWSGARQVVDLAGDNVLAFMTVCKSVWAAWQRRNPRDAERYGVLPTFTLDDQIIGITEASQIWFKKIQVGLEADRRAVLISALGSWFRRRMLEDRRLSNPGHNGFSLREYELREPSAVAALIKVCRDHGDLMEVPHTTRNRDQERRVKWYLHPLLCPFFRIPYVRTKEPIYSALHEIQTLFDSQRGIGPSGSMRDPAEFSQPQLPGFS